MPFAHLSQDGAGADVGDDPATCPFLQAALASIQQHLDAAGAGKGLTDFGLPALSARAAAGLDSRMVLEERGAWPVAQQVALRDRDVPRLNTLQRAAYDAVMAAARSGRGVFFFR